MRRISGLVQLFIVAKSLYPKRDEVFAAYLNTRERIIFSIYVFLWRSHKKNKYRWFKVEGFGDG